MEDGDHLPENETSGDNLQSQRGPKTINEELNPEALEKKASLQAALLKKDYVAALQLVKKDAEFPEDFALRSIDKKISSAPDFVNFVKKRNELHSFIAKKENKDVIEKVKPLIEEGSRYLLNTKNQSALYIALWYKNFEAVEYFKSVGIQCKSSAEMKEAEKRLNREESRKLSKINLNNLEKVEKPYLETLFNKSSFRRPTSRIGDAYLKNFILDDSLKLPDYGKTMKSYYSELDKTPEISAIMKVFDFTDHFSIAYDFDERNVSGIVCSNSGGDLGVTDGDEGVIVIGARRLKIPLMATIAHELTHMAMEVLYENRCNPYDPDDVEGKKEFKKVVDNLENNLNKIQSHEESKILLNTFKYKEDRRHSEAIVRVSQILIECKNGRTWLETNAKDLFNYYKKVIDECNKIDGNGTNNRIIRKIKNVNGRLGEIERIKDLGLNFKIATADATELQTPNLKSFFNTKKRIFIIKTDNVTLCALKTLQTFYEKKYPIMKQEYFVFTLETFSAHYKKITSCCRNEVLKNLIILIHNLNDSDVKPTVDRTLVLMKERSSLKVIFIIRKGEERLESRLKRFIVKRVENISLNDLDDNSINKIMEKDIIFQGTAAKFNQVINGKQEVFDLMKGDIVGKICDGEILNVGGKILGTSSLEAAYSENVQEINVDTLYSYLAKPGYIFIFNGLEGENKIDALKEKMRDHVDPQKYLTSVNAKICAKFEEESNKTTNKRVLFTGGKLADADFKKFCSLNSSNKIYLIDVICEEKSIFLLKLQYNQEFYLTREFKIVEEQNGIRKILPTKLDEDVFLRKFDQDNLIIICDEPGMGKTTTLTKIYEKMSDRHWVIKITLKDSLDAIKKIDDKKFSLENLITFLTEADKNLKNSETKTFLKLAIESEDNFLNPLFIFFDGYDEVLKESDRNKIVFLLENLKARKEFKVLITTRPNFKNELLGKLKDYVVQFEKFKKSMIDKFIDNYLRERFSLVLKGFQFRQIFEFESKNKDSKLTNYRTALIKKMKEIFGKEVDKFIGTPLQLQLTLANSFESFKEYITTNEKPNFNFLGENLLDIYENYLEMKYEVYFNKVGKNDVAEKNLFKNSFNDYNKNLAEFLTLDTTNPCKNEGFSDQHKVLMHCSGILNTNSEFIHNTFREYFAAQVIMDYLKNKNDRKLNLNIAEILIKDIFLKPEYQFLRQFINFHLKKIPVSNWDDVPDLKEIGKIMGLLWGKNPTVNYKKGTVLHVALTEENEAIFEFIIYCCKRTFSNDQFYNLLIGINGSSNTVFHVVASTGKENLCKILLDQVRDLKLGPKCFRDLLVYKVNKGLTPLQLANGEVKIKRNGQGKSKKPNSAVAALIKAELDSLEELLNL